MSQILNIEIDKVASASITILTNVGVPLPLAKDWTEFLLQNDRDGYPSHGAMRLEDYLKDIQSEKISVARKPVLERCSSIATVLNGEGCIAIRVINEIKRIIEQTNLFDVYLFSLKNCHHLGRLSQIAKLFTSKDYAVDLTPISRTGL